MPRRAARPRPTRDVDLSALTRTCPECGTALWAASMAHRIVTTLDGLIRLGLQVRRCRNRDCRRFGGPLRPGPEGRPVLPQHEFGLDIIALVGTSRHAEHRSGPGIHAELVRRGVPICPRSVGNLPGRSDELPALSSSDAGRLRRITAAAGEVVLAIDGLPPDSATRSSGSSATCSVARSCWPGACRRPAATTWRSSCAGCRTPCRCRSSG